jgi:hypothetical protein
MLEEVLSVVTLVRRSSNTRVVRPRELKGLLTDLVARDPHSRA